MWQIQVNDKDVRGLTLRHTKYSGDVIAEHPRLQILAQRFQLGNLPSSSIFSAPSGSCAMRRWSAPILRMIPVSSSRMMSSDAYLRSSSVGLRNCTLLPAIVATHVPRQYRSEEAAMA